MPFFKKNNRVINFVHIPKTAGTSILNLLETNRWEKITVPDIKTDHPHKLQYLPVSLDLQPDFEFCVMRDPEDRLISSVYHSLRALKEIDDIENLSFDASRYEMDNEKIIIFVQTLFDKIFLDSGIDCDDHRWLPQSAFISENTKIFDFSNLDELLKNLIYQDIIDKSSELKRLNCNNKKVEIKPNWSENPDVWYRFLNFYGQDYEILQNHFSSLQSKG